jgi:hypothetical protein
MLDGVPSKLIEMILNLQLVIVVTRLCELEILSLCLEENFAIPGFFPPVFLRPGIQKSMFEKIGNVDTDFIQTVLTQMIQRGQPNRLTLPSSYAILDDTNDLTVKAVIMLPFTVPMECQALQYTLHGSVIVFTLKESVARNIRVKISNSMRAEMEIRQFRVYHEYTQGQFMPHEYPKDIKIRKSLRREPWLMDEDEIKNLIGARVGDFWSFCDFFEGILGSNTIAGLTLPAQVLLYRSRLR